MVGQQEQEAIAIRARRAGQIRVQLAGSVLTEELNSTKSTVLRISHKLQLMTSKLEELERSHRLVEDLVDVEDLAEVIATHETFVTMQQEIRLRALQRMEDMAEQSQPQIELQPSDSASNVGHAPADFSGFEQGVSRSDMIMTTVNGGVVTGRISPIPQENTLVPLFQRVTTEPQGEMYKEGTTVLTKASVGSSEDEARKQLPTPRNVKLPKMELKILYDSNTNYINWRETFNFMIRYNTNLSDLEKMTHLKGAVSGEAGRLVEMYSLEEGNFEVACQALDNRYGRTSLLRLKKIRNLTSLSTPTGTGANYITSLFDFLDNIQANVHALSKLGVSGEVCEAFLCPNIVDKMPATIRAHWSTARETEGKEGDLKYLLSFVRREITGLQLAQEHATPQQKERSGAGAHQQGSATALVAANGSGRTRSESKCPFCPKATHYVSECSKFASASRDTRWAMLKSAHGCFKCLAWEPGHNFLACCEYCTKCRGPHHDKLCGQTDGYGVRPSNSGATGDTTTPQRGIPHQTGIGAAPLQWKAGQAQGGFVRVQAPPEEGPTNFSGLSGETEVTANGLKPRESVLQSACTYLRARDGSCIKAMMVFDTGANRSYISRSMAKRLKPETVGHEWVSYAAFGGESASRSVLSSIHRVELSDRGGGSHYLDLPEVPQICPPLTRTKIPAATLEVFSHLPLADDEYGSGSSFTVDILIGADWYFHFVEPSTAIRSEGLVAMSTPFGFIIGGCSKGMTPRISAGGALISVQSPSWQEIHPLGRVETKWWPPGLDSRRKHKIGT